MGLILRIIGAFWIVMSARPVYFALKRLIASGSPDALALKDLLYLLLLAGGIGLLLLKEWGRWVILIGTVALLILIAGPSLMQGNFTPLLFRHLIFYGIFIALLVLPQSRAATRK